MAWRQYILTIIVAVLAALAVRQFVLTAYKVPTGSMQPALKPGDFIFSLRTAYGLKVPWAAGERWFARMPERGDVVVFTYPNQPDINYVKRVIALPGDQVQITNNRLTLNGEHLPYERAADVADENPNPALFEIRTESMGPRHWDVVLEKGATGRDFGPLQVPSGEIFLLGDNRDTSDDSRYWGTVPVSQIRGRAVLIWMSLDWQKDGVESRIPRPRWNRVFSFVH